MGSPPTTAGAHRRQQGGRRRRAPWNGPIWLKLAALAMVPLLAAGLLSARLVTDHLTRTRDAGRIAALATFARDAEGVSAHTASAAYLLDAQIGLGPLLAASPATRTLLAADRDAVDRSLAGDFAAIAHAGRADAAIAPLAVRVKTLLAERDRPGADPQAVFEGLSQLDTQLYAAALGAIQDMQPLAVGLSGTTALGSQVATVHALLTVTIDGEAILSTIFQQLALPAGTGRDVVQGRLLQATQVAAADLQDLLAADRSTEVRHFVQVDRPAVDALLAEAAALGAAAPDRPLGAADLIALAPAATGFGLHGVGAVQHALTTVAHTADQLHRAARRSMELTVAALALLVLVTLVLTVLLSRSVRLPMEALARRAARISGGTLETGAEGGAREIAEVAGALNHAVTNLDRLRAQAEALGHGDLADPVLADPLPGALGASLFASVQLASDLQRQLGHRASHDPLTGLLNRRAAQDELDGALAAGHVVAAMFIDLDGFKQINDTYGHAFGDQVLQVTSRRLVDEVGSAGVACRLGGDEFVVIVRDVLDVADVKDLGDRLLGAVIEPMAVDLGEVGVGASVGIAVSDPALPYDASQLMGEADVAVYQAKRSGRRQIRVFDESTRLERASDLELEADLRSALAAGELDVWFQPVIGVQAPTVWGFEALLRWGRGGAPVASGDLIRLARKSDLIIDIDRWVLDRACQEARAWSDHPALAGRTVSVNIAARHLGRCLIVDDVMRAIDRHRIRPSSLVVEVTEAALVGPGGAAREELRQLGGLGVGIGMDDFGTGLSSIAELERVPADYLKLDGGFFEAGAQDARRATVAGLLIGAAHALGMRVVAEGVEDGAQLEMLRTLGCELAQGFLFAPAMPGGDLAPWIGQRSCSKATTG